MVAATKNTHHDSVYQVIDSLAQPSDSQNDVQNISKAIRSTFPETVEEEDDPARINMHASLAGENVVSIGGFPEIVTAIETDLVDVLMHPTTDLSHYGINFSKEEQQQIATYQANIRRSRA